ncbi:MAG: hypothetical protein K2N05_10455 [Muribaculaceae bacterium]|nr:hypothetical protein [Muribaculaceae bacterium]
MKRLFSLALFLVMLLGTGFSVSALKVTLEWDTPGSVELIAEDNSKYEVELTADQTSYVWETEKSYGYIYVYPADGYRLTGAETADGSKQYKLSGIPPHYTLGFYGSDNGSTVKITTAKLERNDSFTVDVVNGLANIMSAEFTSGYKLDLEKGSHTYNFNAEYDNPLEITLQSVEKAYSITLNGVEIAKNSYSPEYENIEVKNGDNLTIQVYESAEMEPSECTFSVAYGSGMKGCITNIRDTGNGKWYYPDDFDNKAIDVLENTTVRINFNNEDYTIESLYLNDIDVTDRMITSSFDGSQFIEFVIKKESNVLKIEGTPKSFGTVDFTGYIINGEGVCFSNTYHGVPFEVPEGEAITEDIKITSTLTMPASETLKYTIPTSEKSPKFFFYPKDGYYIADVYTLTPDDEIEKHSGNASMTANINGTTFYMIVRKLPESYNATLKVTGNTLRFRVESGSTLSSTWDNPAPRSYNTDPGEREISFIPGFATPLVFSFSGSDDGTAALYLDGAEVTGIENSESGGYDYYVTPYFPSEENDKRDVTSTIEVYNSFTQRPVMSGASLELTGAGKAEFFYSPVLHKADPEGQVVISGTQFIVRPADPRMEVTYKGDPVELDENGEFVFEAKGNIRNNVVRVGDIKEEGNVEILETIKDGKVTVITLDGKVLLDNAPKSRLIEVEKGIYLVNGKKNVIK